MDINKERQAIIVNALIEYYFNKKKELNEMDKEYYKIKRDKHIDSKVKEYIKDKLNKKGEEVDNIYNLLRENEATLEKLIDTEEENNLFSY